MNPEDPKTDDGSRSIRNNIYEEHHLDGDVEGGRAFWPQNFFVESQDVGYIYTSRNNIHILDLEKTKNKLTQALEFAKQTAWAAVRFCLSAPSARPKKKFAKQPNPAACRMWLPMARRDIYQFPHHPADDQEDGTLRKNDCRWGNQQIHQERTADDPAKSRR
jgi:hypothetical protein